MEVTDENIKKLNEMSIDELLDLDTSGRPKEQLRIIGEHATSSTFTEETNKYQSKYLPLRTIELVEEARIFPKDTDSLHRHVFLDVANEKGVYNIVHELIS